jgi:hypothetical protein
MGYCKRDTFNLLRKLKYYWYSRKTHMFSLCVCQVWVTKIRMFYAWAFFQATDVNTIIQFAPTSSDYVLFNTSVQEVEEQEVCLWHFPTARQIRASWEPMCQLLVPVSWAVNRTARHKEIEGIGFDIFTERLLPQLQEVSVDYIFIHDVAQPHRHMEVPFYLDQNVPRRWSSDWG